MPTNLVSVGSIDQKIGKKNNPEKHMSNKNRRGRCQSTHSTQRISIIPTNRTLGMNPKKIVAESNSIHRITKLSSKLQHFTNNHKLKIKKLADSQEKIQKQLKSHFDELI